MCVLYMYVFLTMCLCVFIFICVCVFCVFLYCLLLYCWCVTSVCPDGRMRVCYQQAPAPHTPGPHAHIFTAPSSHIHLNTVTPDYTHTFTYRIMLHPHTGANGDLQRGDQKGPYIVLKTLKFLLREWAKDQNARSSKKLPGEKGLVACVLCVCICGYV